MDRLAFLYGDEQAEDLASQLFVRLEAFGAQHPELQADLADPSERLTERDAILITYGDQVIEPDKAPLVTLAEVLETYAKGAITGVHILPFFPYSSDDGFSVIDYAEVNPDLGDWPDVERLGATFPPHVRRRDQPHLPAECLVSRPS